MAGEPLDIEAVFHAARQVPAGERAAYLDRACGGDPAARPRVERLLAAEGEVGSFLDAPAPELDATRDQPAADRPGALIGPYKLLEQIGEGAFGVVFMAEQQHPVRRKVALKVLKAGMDARQVVARFEAERQALAVMDHPNIAKVLDGGETPAGRPYFVLELVRGVPITDYCDRAHLPPRDRLSLFVQVCQAVQHAHQKGVIHRDLKPSNVLVSAHEGEPAVKVIDFGVAKAAGQPLTDKTLFTGFAQLVGTPLYMSPEQAAQSPDVDTRTDVYALGVLLYELLTGTTPITRERFRRAAYDEIRRIIREEDPPRPSTRLSESQDALPSISAQRKTEPARLTRLVRGDLDWIVMKALEKDRNRRYETATAFAADLHRYLADEPVLACPPSAGYRVRKFARRNRGPVVATGLVAAALVGGIIGTTVGLVRAERARADAVAAREAEAGQRRAAEDERAVARAVNVFWLHDVLRQADSREQADRGFTADPDLSVKEALNRAADRIGDRFRDQPLVEAAARQAIGEAFVGIGEYPRALPQAQRALALRAERLGPDHPLTLASTDGLGTAYLYLDRPADALGLLEAAVKARREALGPAHPDTLDSVVGLAICYRMLGRTAEAVALQEDGLRLAREHLGPDDPVTIRSLNNLASHYRFAGRVPEAIAGQEEALKLQQARRGPRHPATLVTMGLLAMAYEAAGRFSAAVALFEETLTLMKVHLSPDHPHTLTTMSGLAGAYRGAGRLAEAVATQEEALKRWQTRRGPRDPFVLRQVGFLADLQSDVGRHDLAEPLFRRFLEVLEQDWADEWEAFEARSLLGGALLGQKKYAAAEPLLLAGYAGMRKREAKVIEEGAGGKLRAAGRRVVQLYEAWGKPAEAARWRKELGDPPPAK